MWAMLGDAAAWEACGLLRMFTDVDLTSHPPGEMTLVSSSAQGLDERNVEIVAMFEGRAA